MRAADDALTSCLVLLTRYFHRPSSAQTLTAGLPLENGCLTPELFPRAAKRAGLSSRVMSRSLERISALTLPAVLLLKGGSACVAVKKTDAAWTLLQAESDGGEITLTHEQLAAEYDGRVIFSRPAFRFDARTHEDHIPKPGHWLWGALQHVWPYYSEVLLATLLLNIFALVTPLFAMNVYDRVVPNQAMSTLWVLAIGAVLVAIFDFVMKSLRAYFLDVAGKQVDTMLSATIFETVLGLRTASRPESVGGLANTLHEYEGFREFITSATITTLIDLPFSLIFLLIIFWLGGPLVIIPLLAIPAIVFSGVVLQKPLADTMQQALRVGSQKHATLIETLSGIETIKALAAESPVQRRWEQTVGEAGRLGTRGKLLATSIVNLAQLLQQLAYVLVIIGGVYLINKNALTVGGLIAVSILTTRALMPFAQVAGLITRYFQTLQALRGVDNIMRQPLERPIGVNFVHHEQFFGDIEFRNVTFAYPGQDIPALKNVSFRIKRGERVAFIGRIGSGKTTLEKLLLGLYSPSEGSIWVDGIDLRQIDPANLRHNMGHVPQDVILFHGSIRDNIVLGAPYVDDSTVLRAAELTGVSEFTQYHPRGLDMPTGERGSHLSGGQRQSVALARAILLDPPILAFDEPTNALDNRSEEQFKVRLEKHLREQTLLLVTHRMSLLSLVSRLIVMDGGRVIADGPKEQVLEAISGGRVRAAGN